jgi:hypothetical protein
LLGAIGTSQAGTPARDPQADSVSINQEDYRIALLPESSTSSRLARVLIRLDTKVTLATQAKAYLRAAITLESENSFSTVFAKEVGRGRCDEILELKIDRPKLKIIRVVVWLDRDGAASPPRPLASDNIAFKAAAFLNLHDR